VFNRVWDRTFVGGRVVRWALGALVVATAALSITGTSYAASTIDAGGHHTCAIHTAGTPLCWGYNGLGQSAIPAGIGAVARIAAGQSHTCAIKTTGTAVCWGSNNRGQTTIPAGIGAVTQIAAGQSHTCAIKTGGTPVCWGMNLYGQSAVPTAIGTVKDIAPGASHTCAIKTTGIPVCWGSNIQEETTVPATLGTVTQITAGKGQTCAIKTNGTPVCWGRNISGQAQIPSDTGAVTQISAGYESTCAVTTAGKAVCWGNDYYGQTTVPVGIGAVTEITAGDWHTCARNAIGSVVCWGQSNLEQLRVPAELMPVAKPVNTAPPLISGALNVGSVLDATTGTWSGAVTSYAYQWKRCTSRELTSCATIAGAQGSTYTLAPADDKRLLRVAVTATNALGSTTSPDSQETFQVVRPKPVNTTLPKISGTPKVGQLLTATTGTWTNVPTSYTIVWKRCTSATTLSSCTTITGASKSTYALTAADDVRYLRVVVTASNSGGSAISPDSNPTARITWLTPVNTAAPVISGIPRVGQRLTTTNGTWANIPTRYAYAWRRCTSATTLSSCTTIAGAGMARYMLTAADNGSYIRAAVTATNSGGAAVSPASTAIKVTT